MRYYQFVGRGIRQHPSMDFHPQQGARMKAIIDRKKYDTKTATLVAEISIGNRRDFRFFSEKLYVTDRGAWFIHGEGGPGSSYSRPVNIRDRCGVGKIRTLTADEAYTWMEEQEENEAIEHYFIDQIEDA